MASNMDHGSVDQFGTLASAACAVHCITSATLPGALGALGLGVLLGPGSEWAFTFVALGIAVAALLLGWRKHRSTRVVAMLGAGVVALLLSRLLEGFVSEALGTTLSVLAGLTLVVGHLSNLVASRRSLSSCESGGGAGNERSTV